MAQQNGLCSKSAPCPSQYRKCLELRRVFAEDYGTYGKWLDQDVRWIVTPEERAAFRQLQNDAERDQFIEMFWLRRDPNPDTVENEFKGEHYRRMMYANEHFGTALPGWKTDRGRIYIMDGPPDEITNDTLKSADAKGQQMEFPRQTWHYAKLPTEGKPADLQFVDLRNNGEYQYAMSREEKDALLNLPVPDHSELAKERAAQGLVQYVGSFKVPEIRFKDLDELVAHKIKATMLPFTISTSCFRITDYSDWVPVKIEFNGKDVQWTEDGESRRAKVRMFARLVHITGRIEQVFEDELDLVEPTTAVQEKSYSFSKALPLPAGLYRLEVAMQDVVGDRLGSATADIDAKDYVISKPISTVVLSLGSSDPIFHPSEQRTAFSGADSVYAFAQGYDLTVDPKADVPDATIDYEVFSRSENKADSVLHLTDKAADLKQRGEQISLSKELNGPWKPGVYDLVLSVIDNKARQQMCSQTQFTVR